MMNLPLPQRTNALNMIGPWLVLLMTCYQWGLCFVSTNIMPTPSSLVAVVEAMIVLGAVATVMKGKQSSTYIVLLASILLYFAALMTIRGNANVQDARNVIIPLTFFFLGRRYSNVNGLDQLIWRISCLVLVGAVLEYGLTDIYLRVFNIQKYYTDRGLVQGALEYINTSVLFNGERFTGRNLLPFLGNQRISSVFLEPVSMGNFAVLLTAWGLSFTKEDRRLGWRHLAMSIIFIIAADSRFGCLMMLGLVAVRCLPLLRHRIILSSLPFVAVVALISTSLLLPEAGINDTFLGRIVRSGEALTEMSPLQWLGMGELKDLGDMGVAYTFVHMGLIAGLALAFFLTAYRFPPGQASTFQAMATYYATGILMISGTSFYSAKTAALLWFALGALKAGSSQQSAKQPREMFLLSTENAVVASALEPKATARG